MRECALQYSCDFCGAVTEQMCVSRKTGKRASYPHAVRYEGVRQAWYEGYVDGRAEMAAAYRNVSDPEIAWYTPERFEQSVDAAIKEAEEMRHG